MRKFLFITMLMLLLPFALALQSSTKPTGILKVPNGLFLELKFNGKSTPVVTGQDIPIPIGIYEPFSLTCLAKGKSEFWTIKVAPPNWGKIKEISVKEGEATTLDAGPPFILKTIVYKTENGPTGKTIPFTLRIFGKAGELYDLNSFKKGQSQAPQIAFQIIDEKNNILTTNTLPFG